MGAAASTTHTIPRLATGDPRAGGVPAPTIAGLSRRNKIRLKNGLLALLGSLDRDTAGDDELRAYLIGALGKTDAAIGGEVGVTP